MKQIVISNRKGGSGKSTTAINLASELSKEHQVLLIDLDTQGHSSIGVGSEPFESGGCHKVFEGEALSQSFVPTISENLTLAAASMFFDPYSSNFKTDTLREAITKERLEEFFDFCVIDTPPTFDAILKNSLVGADCVVIPLIPHPLGIIGAQQIFRAIYKSTLNSKKPISYIGILPTMFNFHIKEHKEILDQAINIFGKDRVFEPITNDMSLSKQFYTKIPVVLSSERSRGARDYRNFTNSLLKQLG